MAILGLTIVICLFIYSRHSMNEAELSRQMLSKYLTLAFVELHNCPETILTGQDIVQKQEGGDPKYHNKQFSGSKKRIQIIWKGCRKNSFFPVERPLIPVFWEKTPQYCNRHLVVFANLYVDYIPAKKFRLFLEHNEDINYLQGFLPEDLRNRPDDNIWLALLKHFGWKWFGWDVE